MKIQILSAITVMASTFSAQAETVPLFQMKSTDQVIVAQLTPAMDEAVFEYAEFRKQEEYDKGQEGCAYDYSLLGRQEYVLYYSYKNNSTVYGSLLFNCLDDDGMTSTVREAVILTCSGTGCSIQKQDF